ncbi:MAG TPA: hypothetical protein VMS56_14580 [Thermoanaerobaculia bacterium]|nr:hypothetical protein [Thermoanaerobaculia bacterium]
MRSHSAQAARHGATREQIEALADFENGPFSDAEKAALSWAEALTRGNGTVAQPLFERLRSHWEEGEIVEITEMAALFNYFNRVANALEIEPTLPGEGL